MGVLLNKWGGHGKGFEHPKMTCWNCFKPATVYVFSIGKSELPVCICAICLSEALQAIGEATLAEAAREK